MLQLVLNRSSSLQFSQSSCLPPAVEAPEKPYFSISEQKCRNVVSAPELLLYHRNRLGFPGPSYIFYTSMNTSIHVDGQDAGTMQASSKAEADVGPAAPPLSRRRSGGGGSGGADPCKTVRSAYDRCFNKWYSETYVKMGPWSKEQCVAEWEAYQACFSKRLEGSKLEKLVKDETEALMRASSACS